MKKILILVNTIKSGGAEKQSLFLLNALKDIYPTYFIIFHKDSIEDKMLQLIQGDNFVLIELHGNNFSKLAQLYKLISTNKITHLFTYLTKPNFIGAIIGRIAKVRYIYSGIRNSNLPKWKYILEKIANYLTSKTIINNYNGEIVFKKKDLKNLLVIPNCYPNIDEPFTRKINNTIKIITVGRFVDQKDYKTALHSISLLKNNANNFIFQIVGYGKLEAQIKNWVSEFELDDEVQILINPSNIGQLLKEADIYLSTSIFEGTSNSIMEAMNASLPIVATDVGDNNRLIRNRVNGYLNDIGDYNGIAMNLKSLIYDLELREKFGMQSNFILKENHSFEIFKENYIKLIEQK